MANVEPKVELKQIRSNIIDHITLMNDGVKEKGIKMLEEFENNDTLKNRDKIINEMVSENFLFSGLKDKAEELFDQYNKLRISIMRIEIIDDIAWKYVLIDNAQCSLDCKSLSIYIERAKEILKIYEDDDCPANERMIIKELSEKYNLEGKEDSYILAKTQFYNYAKNRKL